MIKCTYNGHKKLPTSGDLVGVTPHPSDPAQAFPHTSYPHWGILMWEGPLPNNIIWIWKAWVDLCWYNYIKWVTNCICNNHGSNPTQICILINNTFLTLSETVALSSIPREFQLNMICLRGNFSKDFLVAGSVS